MKTSHEHAVIDAPAAIEVSHADRVIDRTTGLQKIDLVRYYAWVAEWMLPHLRGRACSLLRAPSGVSGDIFFQKHLGQARIADVRALPPSLFPGHAALLEVPTPTAVVAAAQMNVVEFHTWNAPIERIDQPDRIVFDLDPGEGVDWGHLAEGAALTRSALHRLELESWLKTSGGKGLHVVVPIEPREPWPVVRAFAQCVVEELARRHPDRFVARAGASHRLGKLFIDYLRNTHGATTIAAYSARARAGLGVSLPVRWQELESLRSAGRWTIANTPQRLASDPEDPWAGYWHCHQSLEAGLKRFRLEG